MVSGAQAFARPEPKTLAGDLLLLFTSQSGNVTFTSANGMTVHAHSDIILARCPSLLKSRNEFIQLPEHSSVLTALLTYFTC